VSPGRGGEGGQQRQRQRHRKNSHIAAGRNGGNGLTSGIDQTQGQKRRNISFVYLNGVSIAISPSIAGPAMGQQQHGASWGSGSDILCGRTMAGQASAPEDLVLFGRLVGVLVVEVPLLCAGTSRPSSSKVA
jgi:hypothetical protein